MVGPLDEILAPPPAPAAPSFRYGTVTGTNPLRVRLDGDTNPVASTPTTIAAVTTGDRVLVMIYHRQLTVLGVVGGERVGAPFAMAAGEVELTLSGTPRSGNTSVSFPAGRFTQVPIVTTSVNHADYSHAANNVGPNGFDAYVMDTRGGSNATWTLLYWQAVQMTPGSAAG